VRLELGVSKVTDKYQVTIPKDVREEMGLKPGEEVIVESDSRNRIVVKRFRSTRDPLLILIGKKQYPRHVPIRELEEKMESR
jgi:AbrB family looped-hinge helix DNA binding protein